MPTEQTVNQWWLAVTALGFLGASVVFLALARALLRQYHLGGVPLTDLARALLRQKVAISLFGAAWFVVIGTAWTGSVWGWTPAFWPRMAYRSAATVTIYLLPAAGILVMRAMGRDARRVEASDLSDAHRNAQRVATGRAEGYAAGVEAEQDAEGRRHAHD